MSKPLEPLIPGLPDDVAKQCLLRLPVNTHASCKKVSKRWNSIFKTKRRFSTLRKRLLFQDPRLFVFAYDIQTERIHLKVLDLFTLSWTTRHITPDLYLEAGTSFRSVSIPRQGVLFAFGGASRYRSTDHVFLRYNVRENSWTTVKALTGAIGLVLSGAIDGKVYVTGLDRELSDGEHDPVEVFDPERETWKHVPNYPKRNHGEFHGAVVFDGKLLLTYADESMVGRIYDPKAEKWENMARGLTEGLLSNGSAVETHGHLFVLAPKDRTGLRVYDSENDRWDVVGGNALPEDVDSESLVCSWDGKIYVVKYCLGVVVGNVSRIASCSNPTKSRFRVRWEKVGYGPEGFYGSLISLCAQVLIG